MSANNGENFHYILYFQEVGPGEKELEADPQRSMRMILWGCVRRRPYSTELPAPLPAVGTGFLDMFSEPPDPLPAVARR